MEFSKQLIYESETTTTTATNQSKDYLLNVVHFNDVYNIESRDIEPCGGAARFVRTLEYLKNLGRPTLILFSGDALSPSSVSMLVKGKQMIEILNECSISCACLGNHDFDFGIDVLAERIKESRFPWVLSNVFDVDTKKPLANVADRFIIELEGGVKVGIIGLVEQCWLETLSSFSFDDIIYRSFIDVGRELAVELKQKEKCDIVIALTHNRWPNDVQLAEEVAEIDLILGGHDHDYGVKQIVDNKKWIIKSGTDFRELSLIQISIDYHRKEENNDHNLNLILNFNVNRIEKYIIDKKIPPKESIQLIVDSYLENLNAELDVILGHMNVELDGRFNSVRTMETNMGNFICDIMLASVNADCALLNSGSLRSDCLHPKGEFKVRDLKKILPFLDESIVLLCKGSQIHQALENSVSQYPKLEGRFPQVSGIRFAFDPTKPPGNRIDPKLIKIQDEYIDLNREYSLITKLYIKQGKDGFDCLSGCPVLVDEENIPMLYNLVENHFKTISALNDKQRARNRLRSSIVPLFVVNRLMNQLSTDKKIFNSESAATAEKEVAPKLNFHNAAFLISKVLFHRQKTLTKKQRQMIKESEIYQQKMKVYEEKSIKLAPQLEDRIVCIKSPADYHRLLNEFNQHQKHHQDKEPPSSPKKNSIPLFNYRNRI